MAKTFAQSKPRSKQKVCWVVNASGFGFRQNENMDEPGITNFIAHYRKLAGMTQQALAEALDEPTSKGTISQYESAKRGFSLQRLMQLAGALEVRPGLLLDGPVRIPTQDELAGMIALAQSEIEFGSSIADYPRAVASSLHEQLRQYVYGRANAPSGAAAPEKAPAATSPVRPATKRFLQV